MCLKLHFLVASQGVQLAEAQLQLSDKEVVANRGTAQLCTAPSPGEIKDMESTFELLLQHEETI